MNFEVNKSWTDKKVMFLDVATKSTGYAFYGKLGEVKQLKYGAIQTESPYLYTRLQILNREMQKINDLFTPDIVVMEAGFAETSEKVHCPKCNNAIYGTVNFWDRSAEVSMMLAEARGAAAAAFDCPMMKISNTEWKKGIGIETRESLKRSAVKYEVYLQACSLWDISLPITTLKKKATFDESDACAALAYVLRDLRCDE